MNEARALIDRCHALAEQDYPAATYPDRVGDICRARAANRYLAAVIEDLLHRAPALQVRDTTPKDDGWIEWKGGKCPIPDGAKFDLKFFCGATVKSAHNIDWNWERHFLGCDIVAYKVKS